MTDNQCYMDTDLELAQIGNTTYKICQVDYDEDPDADPCEVCESQACMCFLLAQGSYFVKIGDRPEFKKTGESALAVMNASPNNTIEIDAEEIVKLVQPSPFDSRNTIEVVKDILESMVPKEEEVVKVRRF